jgi:hypothetical protein
MGGYICYVTNADGDKDDNDDDSQKSDDGDSELLTVHPRGNSLSLVYREMRGVDRFVKYINHRATILPMNKKANKKNAKTLPNVTTTSKTTNGIFHDFTMQYFAKS